MNQKPTPERLAYRKRQLAELSELLPDPSKKLPDLPEDSVLAQQHAVASARRIRAKLVPDQAHTKRTPEKLPDPWLFNSESLLRELDRCRELVLQIPIADHHATHFAINVAIDALWNLRDTLWHLIRLHREGQRSFARKADPATQPKAMLKHRKQSANIPQEKIHAIRDIAVLQATPCQPPVLYWFRLSAAKPRRPGAGCRVRIASCASTTTRQRASLPKPQN